jgi:hypothetical protein
MHNYSLAAIVIELCLDLPGKYGTATMIVGSSDQIVIKAVHDHEKETRDPDCMIMHSRSAFDCALLPRVVSASPRAAAVVPWIS